MDLQKAFAMQQEMRNRMIEERGINWTDEQWMLQFLTCLIDEIGEVRAELNWKHWKNPKEVNMDNVREEITDIWIFLIELTMSSGMSLSELEERFNAKTAENHARQDGTSSKPGYAIPADAKRAVEIANPGLPTTQQLSADANVYAEVDAKLTQQISAEASTAGRTVSDIANSIASALQRGSSLSNSLRRDSKR